MKSLHWLPVSFRIKFEIHLVTYKASCNNQPIYLKEMLKDRTRSSDQNVLFVPRDKIKMGEGSFSVTAPKKGTLFHVRISKLVQSFRKKRILFYFNQAFSRMITTTILDTPLSRL